MKEGCDKDDEDSLRIKKVAPLCVHRACVAEYLCVCVCVCVCCSPACCSCSCLVAVLYAALSQHAPTRVEANDISRPRTTSVKERRPWTPRRGPGSTPQSQTDIEMKQDMNVRGDGNGHCARLARSLSNWSVTPCVVVPVD